MIGDDFDDGDDDVWLAIRREYLIFVTYDHKNGNEDNESLMV